MSLLAWLSLLSLVIWGGVILTRRGFWRCDQRLDSAQADRAHAPDIAVVVPARDEAPTIGATVRSLLNQSYPGQVRVFVVDDNSTDGTADQARKGAAGVPDGPQRLHIVSGQPLEPGWSGKLWAVHQGLQAAAEIMPEARYVLLTDADIEHAPGNLGRLVQKSEGEQLVLCSLMVKLRCISAWERLLIPAFIFFFQKLYPFPKVNDAASAVAGAAGGCVLVRREALDAIGGVAAIRGALIDDCALAQRLKEQGPIWLGLAGRTRSLRAYHGLDEIWHMVARTAYVQLNHSPLMLLGTVIGMALLYVMPPVAALGGAAMADWPAALLGLAGWLGMAGLYQPTLVLYRRPRWAGLLLPLSAFLYTLMTIDSARRHYAGRGGEWKGRSYSGPDTGITSSPEEVHRADDLAAHVEDITRRSGSSFYSAMRMLPPPKRTAMYAIYAFCRVVDDIADDPGAVEDKRRDLARWRTEIDGLFEVNGAPPPRLPVARALEGPIRRYGLRREDFLAVLDGMETDAHDQVRIQDMDALELYCDQVACAVGRLSNRVFGVDPAISDDVAHHTGLALQLTNIVRDVAEDAARDRLYLPASRLHAHGLDDTTSLHRVLRHPAVVDVRRELASKAGHEFREADRVQALGDRRRMRPAIVMKEVYRAYLDDLDSHDLGDLYRPVKVSRIRKMWIAVRYGLL